MSKILHVKQPYYPEVQMVSSMLVSQTKQELCPFLEGEHAFLSPLKKISLLLTTETKQTLAI